LIKISDLNRDLNQMIFLPKNGVPGIATCLDFFVSFFGSCFLKFINALGNKKTAKLVFKIKWMCVHE